MAKSEFEIKQEMEYYKHIMKDMPKHSFEWMYYENRLDTLEWVLNDGKYK